MPRLSKENADSDGIGVNIAVNVMTPPVLDCLVLIGWHSRLVHCKRVTTKIRL